MVHCLSNNPCRRFYSLAIRLTVYLPQPCPNSPSQRKLIRGYIFFAWCSGSTDLARQDCRAPSANRSIRLYAVHARSRMLADHVHCRIDPQAVAIATQGFQILHMSSLPLKDASPRCTETMRLLGLTGSVSDRPSTGVWRRVKTRSKKAAR
jgi:hypothetical protein